LSKSIESTKSNVFLTEDDVTNVESLTDDEKTETSSVKSKSKPPSRQSSAVSSTKPPFRRHRTKFEHPNLKTQKPQMPDQLKQWLDFKESVREHK